MAVRKVGVEPSSPCAQLEHLVNLLSNRVNRQWNHSLYEVWRPKIVEDPKKQTVSRLHWDGNVPGVCAGTEGTVAPSRAPATG